MRGLGVGELLVSAVASVCAGAETVGAVYGDSNGLEVGGSVCTKVQH